MDFPAAISIFDDSIRPWADETMLLFSLFSCFFSFFGWGLLGLFRGLFLGWHLISPLSDSERKVSSWLVAVTFFSHHSFIRVTSVVT
ncbi:MAG: hypothetical protein V2A34_14960 [Lentisphaerota bacterium]